MWTWLWLTACDADPAHPHRPPGAEVHPANRWYPDQDGDGYGVEEGAVDEPTAPPLFVAVAGDCAPQNPGVHPGADERCAPADVDDDCDGLVDDADVDEALLDANVFWADADGDGLGDPNAPVTGCRQPPGSVTNAVDCAESLPFGFDWVDGADNDCDGVVDVQSTHVPQQWTLGQGLLTGEVVIGDIDGDGCADLLAAVTAGTGPAPAGLAGLMDAHAEGSGEIFGAADFLVEANISMVRSGWDGDGNGALDLVVAEWTQAAGYRSWWLDGAQVGAVALADVAWATYDTGGSWLGPAGDFDGDGALDVSIFDDDLTHLQLFDAAWTGGEPAPWGALDSGYGRGIAGGDLDGDGVDDLAYPDADGKVVVQLGSPDLRDPSLVPTSVVVAGGYIQAVAIADLDGDGVAELVVSTMPGASGRLRAYAGDLLRVGVAGIVWELEHGDAMQFLTVGDFDGDGTDDLAMSMYGNGADTVGILLGGPTVAGALVTSDLDLFTDAPPDASVASLTAGDLDQDGLDELVVGYYSVSAVGHYAVLPGAAPGPCVPR